MAVILTAVAAAQRPAGMSSGIHPEDMDVTCKPCTDFWQYVNGGWAAKTSIPAHRRTYGSFRILDEANKERMRTIVEAAAAAGSGAASPGERRMGALYSSCMDTAAIDARGFDPVKAELARIAGIGNHADLNALMVASQASATGNGMAGIAESPVRFSSGLDAKNPARYIARVFAPNALSLPDRDYYFRDDQKTRDIRKALLEHVTRILTLAGVPAETATADAQAILEFETKLASHMLTVVERRDPDKTYYVTNLAGLESLAPGFDWKGLLKAAGLPDEVTITVGESALLAEMARQLEATPIDTWKAWLRWHTLSAAAPYLTAQFAAERFRFESGVLSGIEAQPPRWQTCATTVDNELGDDLGAAWVAKYFPPEAKRRVTALVENLRAALHEQIEQADWMQPETKQAALKKLERVQVMVGYPDRWKDYSAIAVDRSHYFENVRAARNWVRRYQLARVGQPLDTGEWTMTPPTVNAYSNSTEAKIVFPAGILQPPFFDLNADEAVNYGAIGAVIGHEIGHQFDDSGSRRDATGALRNWWTADDRAKFEARTACVVNQFNALEIEAPGIEPGLHHTGKQVLGEALGDLNGLSTAWRAWQKSLNGKPAPVLDGYTGEQRFFIAFAHIWAEIYRPDALRLLVNTDPHPVSKYRAIATLRNIPEFQKAFQCKDDDPMVRPDAERCRIW